MTNPSTIEHVVMRRVHTMRALDHALSLTTLSAGLFVLALWGIGREVWVARVLENMPHSGSLVSLAQFYIAAFGHTRFVVQALTVVSGVSLVTLAQRVATIVSRVAVVAFA